MKKQDEYYNNKYYIDLKDHFVFNESFREQAERMGVHHYWESTIKGLENGVK